MNDKPTDPAAYAVSLIETAMPGFATRIDAQRDRIEMRAPFYLGGTINGEVFYDLHPRVFPVPSEPTFGADPEPSLASVVGPLSYDPRAVEFVVVKLVEQTRQTAIQMLGLEAVIAERVKRAEQRAADEAYRAGRERGHAEGRRQAIDEYTAAILKGFLP